MTRILTIASLILLASCGSDAPPPSTEITRSPEEMKEKTTAYIRESLDYANGHEGVLNDSFRLWQSSMLPALYETSGYAMLWADPDKRKPAADSMLQFIRQVKYHALLPGDYHLNELQRIDSLYRADSLGKGARRDAALLGRADILLSDAFVRLVNHLRWGRLPDDSVSQRVAAPTAAFMWNNGKNLSAKAACRVWPRSSNRRIQVIGHSNKRCNGFSTNRTPGYSRRSHCREKIRTRPR